MQLFYSNDIFTIQESAVCIGFFDGVHQGHRFLLEKLKDISLSRGLKSTVVTFRNHPKQFFSPDEKMKFLISFDEKIALLSSLGIDYCYVIDFDKEISSYRSEERSVGKEC